MKRIFLIVLDSFGIGAMPDSKKFGDVGVNTLASCATSDKLHIPNMIADMKEKGISTLYLLTDHTAFYERYGWEFYCLAQGDGEEKPSRMYRRDS